MSKADKMFKELGYEKSETDDNNFIVYDYRTGYMWFEIVFDKLNKEYYSQQYEDLPNITPKEHLAIHEKMKELGWI